MEAGTDRTVVLGGKTYLMGKAEWLHLRLGEQLGALEQGIGRPGEVTFADAAAPHSVTTAMFAPPPATMWPSS